MHRAIIIIYISTPYERTRVRAHRQPPPLRVCLRSARRTTGRRETCCVRWVPQPPRRPESRRSDPLSLLGWWRRACGEIAAPRVLFLRHAPRAARVLLAARVLFCRLPWMLRLASRMMLAARMLLCRLRWHPSTPAPRPRSHGVLRFLRVRSQADGPSLALTKSDGSLLVIIYTQIRRVPASPWTTPNSRVRQLRPA